MTLELTTEQVSWDGPDDELLDAVAVAALLGVSRDTVLRWAREGELPCIRLPGRLVRWRRPMLRSWLDSRATPESESGGVRHG